jgi:hypothetical protein
MSMTDEQIEKLYNKHFAAATEQTNPDAAAHAAWEQVRRDTEEWGRRLDEFVAAKESASPIRALLTVGETPGVLRKLGALRLPMSITGDNLGKAMSGKEDHGLPVGLLKNLPEAIAEPIMVFESATRTDSFVVLTELRHERRSVMVSMMLDIVKQNIQINEISSAYKRGSESWYIRQIKDGRLLYQDKKKSLTWARTNRLQLPKVRKLPARLSEGRILTDEDIVKPVPPRNRTESSARPQPHNSVQPAAPEKTAMRPARDGGGRGR